VTPPVSPAPFSLQYC